MSTKRSGARARHEARQRRKGKPMAVRPDQPAARSAESTPHKPAVDPRFLEAVGNILRNARQDAWWYIRNNPIIWRGALGVVAALILLYYLTVWFSGAIFPNVRAMGVGLGGMSPAEAEDALQSAWRDDLRFTVVLDGERHDEVSPAEVGLVLDAEATAAAARREKLGAIPFGTSVAPVVEIDALTMQDYFLDLEEAIHTLPYEAGYTWEDGQVVGVEGRDGRMLNVTDLMRQVELDLDSVVRRRRIEIQSVPLPPTVRDPTLHLDKARALVSQSLSIRGYDPYTNQHYTWPVSAEVFTSWLAAAPASLTLREDTFEPFVEAINSTLNTDVEAENRYIDTDEAADMVRMALVDDSTDISLRVRYSPTQYVVEAGDRGFSISRETGIPYFLIEERNSGVDWNLLSVGQTINLPSRDVTMPEPPVPHKRIVVDIERQYLTAFENGEVVFEWTISTGVANAPTSPGVYQVLSHVEQAVGSSSTLCDAAGLVCGQWQMNWFMGIYEVVPGLVNGFHGAVLLPNGNWLPGGNGVPSTFGCVMSNDEQARQLYEWADIGTVVEIVSREFEPMSDLGQLAVDRLA